MGARAGLGVGWGVDVSGRDAVQAQQWETLREAFERWRTDPSDRQAAEVVLGTLPTIAATCSTFSEEIREQAVALATEEIYHNLHAGNYAEPVLRPWGFFRNLLRWRMLGLVRVPPPAPPRGDDREERSSPLHDPSVAAILDTLVELAVSLREERNRAYLAEAWAVCKRWHHGPATLTEINEHDCALLGIDDPDAVKTAYNRLTRPQSRMRQELLRVLAELESWSPPPLADLERAVAAEAVPRLARCPKPRDGGSTARDESP